VLAVASTAGISWWSSSAVPPSTSPISTCGMRLSSSARPRPALASSLRVLLLRERAETEDLVSSDATTGGGFRSWSTEIGALQRKHSVIEPVRSAKTNSGEENGGGRLTQPPRWPGV
jgi:hypothetical protein